MKIPFDHSVRLSLLGLLLVVSASGLSAAPAADRAAELLARQGRIAIAAAGPFVEAGTYRIQVADKLGRPDARLADGTWLYHGRHIDGSRAEGTLVVRFAADRVTELALVTPAVATAMSDRRPPTNRLLATN